MRSICVRLAGALLLAALLPGAAAAEEMSSTRKFGRGLAAVATFPLEVPGNIAQEARTNGALSAATVGLGMGLVKMVARPVTGVYELATAPFPLPQGFEPVIAPEFPWTYFQSAPGRVYGFESSYLDSELAAIDEIPGAVVERRRGALAVQFPGDLLFASGSTNLSAPARTRLRELSRVILEHPDTVVEVMGYTDSSGTSAENLEISERRATAVQRYLVAQGIAPERVGSQGFGADAPVATNLTPGGRQANRRVEIEVRKSGVAAIR